MTKFLLLGTGLVLVACSASFQVGHAQNEEAVEKKWATQIDRLAAKEMKKTGIPSLQIAIGHKGEIIFEKAYGYANVEEEIPATYKTQYRTASISKWFTGTATMMLVDDGLIDLYAPIQNYCPEYPEKKWEITTRHLLSHTAGVRHYNEGQAEAPSTIHYTDVIAPLDSFKNDPLIFETGMGWGYSSHGFRVLGCVIKGASQKSYNSYLEQSIFGPVKMNSTMPEDTTKPSAERAKGYELARRKRLRPALLRDLSENLPAGGHISTASDLIRFSQSFDQGKLVSKSSIDLMSSLPTATNGKTIDAGYGHGVDFMGAFEGSIGHGGRQEGATTLVVLLPDEDLSIAVLTNARGWRNSNEFTQKVLGTLATPSGFSAQKKQ